MTPSAQFRLLGRTFQSLGIRSLTCPPYYYDQIVKQSLKIPLPPRLEEIAVIPLEPLASPLESNTEYEAISFAGRLANDLVCTSSQFQDCSISLSVTKNLVMQKVRVKDTFLEVGTVNVLDAHNSRWRECRISQGKIVSGNFSGADLSGTLFKDLKIGYLNLIQSDISDVLFENCKFDTLDFVGAKISRVAFLDCHVNEIDLRDTKSENFDLTGLEFQSLNGMDGLRNCYVSNSQLIQLSSVVARELGIKILDSQT